MSTTRFAPDVGGSSYDAPSRLSLIVLPLKISYNDMLKKYKEPKAKLVVFFDSSIIGTPYEIDGLWDNDCVNVSLIGYKKRFSSSNDNGNKDRSPCGKSKSSENEKLRLDLPSNLRVCFQCYRKKKNQFGAHCWIDYGYGSCFLKNLVSLHANDPSASLNVPLKMHTTPQCFTLEKISVKIDSNVLSYANLTSFSLLRNAYGNPSEEGCSPDRKNVLCEASSSFGSLARSPSSSLTDVCVLGRTDWSDTFVAFKASFGEEEEEEGVEGKDCRSDLSTNKVESVKKSVEYRKEALVKDVKVSEEGKKDLFAVGDSLNNEEKEEEPEKKDKEYRKNTVDALMEYRNEYETETKAFRNNSKFAKKINCPYYPAQLTVEDSDKCFLPYAAFTRHETPCVSTCYWFNALKIMTRRRSFANVVTYEKTFFDRSLNDASDEHLSSLCSQSMDMICQYVWIMEYIEDQTVDPNTGETINIEIFGDALRTYSGDCDDLTLAILQMLDNFTSRSFDEKICLESDAVRKVFQSYCGGSGQDVEKEISAGVRCLNVMKKIMRNYVPFVCIEGVTAPNAQNQHDIKDTDKITGAHAAVKCLPEYYFRECISRWDPHHPLGEKGTRIEPYRPSGTPDRCGECRGGGGGRNASSSSSDENEDGEGRAYSKVGSFEPWQYRVPIVIGEGTGELNSGGEPDPSCKKHRSTVYKCKALESCKKPLYPDLGTSPFYKMILFGACNRFSEKFRIGTFRFCTKELSSDGSVVFNRGVSFADLISKSENVHLIPYGWEFLEKTVSELNDVLSKMKTYSGRMRASERCAVANEINQCQHIIKDHTVTLGGGWESFACEYSPTMLELIRDTLKARIPSRRILMPWEEDASDCDETSGRHPISDGSRAIKPIYESWEKMPTADLVRSSVLLQQAKRKILENKCSAGARKTCKTSFTCGENLDIRSSVSSSRRDSSSFGWGPHNVSHFVDLAKDYEKTHYNDEKEYDDVAFNRECTMGCGYAKRYNDKCTKQRDSSSRHRRSRCCERTDLVTEKPTETIATDFVDKIDRICIHWNDCYVQKGVLEDVASYFSSLPKLKHFDYELEVHSSIQYVWVLKFYFSGCTC